MLHGPHFAGRQPTRRYGHALRTNDQRRSRPARDCLRSTRAAWPRRLGRVAARSSRGARRSTPSGRERTRHVARTSGAAGCTLGRQRVSALSARRGHVADGPAAFPIAATAATVRKRLNASPSVESFEARDTSPDAKNSASVYWRARLPPDSARPPAAGSTRGRECSFRLRAIAPLNDERPPSRANLSFPAYCRPGANRKSP
jgi:hypothetical protein